MTETEEPTIYQKACAFAESLGSDVERLDRLVQIQEDVQLRNARAEHEWTRIEGDIDDLLTEDREPLEITYTVKFGADGSVYDWTIHVLVSTGGPACGIDFSARNDAKCWWQDWFTLKEYVSLDVDVAWHYWDAWSLDCIESQIEDMERS